MTGKLYKTIFIAFFFTVFSPFTFINASDLGSLQSVGHGGFTITEGENVTRSDLLSVNRFWAFSFTWPNSVASNLSFLGVFRGTFGDLEGGVASQGVNYSSTQERWNIGQNNIFKNINLPALGDLNTPSGTYTALVGELSSTSTPTQTAEWFASGGVDGVEPVNYSILTFSYEAVDSAENLDSIHFVENGGKRIFDGDSVFRDDFLLPGASWLFNFDWPYDVPGNRALFTMFRGTFGDLDGGVPIEKLNYSSQTQNWGPVNPKSISKSLVILPYLGDAATTNFTYTAMVAERDPKYVDGNKGFHSDDQVLWFASGGTEGIPPKAYSLLEFDYKQEPSPPIDPLILQYEPILLLHPDENYRPMNVEAFVGASALWSTEGIGDTLLKARSTTNPVTVDDIGVSGSEDWYLSFSGDGAKTFDVEVASTTYNELIATGAATTTYYAYKMEDSFTDADGLPHAFIVLQYWYFYAFNDWAEHGGFNNHEGDWETVMVFLDKATEEPQYVAYSAHLNDGEPDLLTQFDSVRRSWDSDEVEKDVDQVKSFVALGSHANYPNNGSTGEHEFTLPFVGTLNDFTSTLGGELGVDSWLKKNLISSTTPDWVSNYRGRWGTETGSAGLDGPKGPNFLKPEGLLGIGSIIRFNEPIKWAGIDKVSEKEVIESTNLLTFIDQSTLMTFDESLTIGTIVSVDQHDEFISFGNTSNVEFLPHFWDLESNLADALPTTTVSFSYEPEEVSNFNIIEQDLSIFLYNKEANSWEDVDSFLNTQTSTISFITTHFSRYTIGAHKWEFITNNVEIKKHWGKYDPKEGTRIAHLTFSGDTLPNTVRVLIPTISSEGIYLLNNTATTTDGTPFINVTNDSQTLEVELLFSIPYKKILTIGNEVIYVPDSLKFDFEIEVQKPTKLNE